MTYFDIFFNLLFFLAAKGREENKVKKLRKQYLWLYGGFKSSKAFYFKAPITWIKVMAMAGIPTSIPIIHWMT
jgi:hypothetical protein